MSSEQRHTFEGIIGQFRQRETPEQIMCLVDNVGLQKLVAHWEMTRLRPAAAIQACPTGESESELWDWLWAHVQIDLGELAGGLGQSPPRLQSMLAMAKSNRLIYPDGRIHEHARKFLHARIAQELGANPAKRGRTR